MVPKADGSANNFDIKLLFEHVTEELGPSVQSLLMPPVVLVQDRSEPSGTASKEQGISSHLITAVSPLLSWSVRIDPVIRIQIALAS